MDRIEILNMLNYYTILKELTLPSPGSKSTDLIPGPNCAIVKADRHLYTQSRKCKDCSKTSILVKLKLKITKCK